MGRELKRVPLNFAWPFKKTWPGYLNPWRQFETQCDACDGSGQNPEMKRLSDLWYDHEGFGSKWGYIYGKGPDGNPAERPPWLIWGNCGAWQHDLTQDEVDALIAAGRLMDFTHVPRTDEQRRIVEEKLKAGGNSWLPEPNGYTPTAAEVNEWSYHFMGHDSINQWICVKARAKRLGIDASDCMTCDGEGRIYHLPEAREAAVHWTKIDPPGGPGFQLWETTSEGSPASPVFDSLDALCEWCEANATTFARCTATAEQWKEMLDDGFVCHREGNNVFM